MSWAINQKCSSDVEYMMKTKEYTLKVKAARTYKYRHSDNGLGMIEKIQHQRNIKIKQTLMSVLSTKSNSIFYEFPEKEFIKEHANSS